MNETNGMNVIQITLTDYDTLLETYLKYSLLLDSLIKESTLNWSKTGLSLHTAKAEHLLELMECDLWDARTHVLKEELKEEEAQDE